MANITQIPAPRVPIIDERTGLISREWFRFFNNLFTLLGDGSTDDITQFLQISPSSEVFSVSQLAETAKSIEALDVGPAYTPQLARYVYGAFRDSTTQTAAAINTAYPITLNATSISVGATRGTPTSRIYVDRPSVYNIQFSLQLNKTTAAAKNVWVWCLLNGADIASSARQVTLAGTSAAAVATANFVLNMNDGDYFELVWSTDDTGCQIVAVAATAPVPAISSVILTITSNISA
jgi:hypothetical protein